MSSLLLQALMAIVAEWRRLRSLAGAELHRAVGRRLPFQRLEAGDLVRAVAERLALGAPAAAPPVALARDHLDKDRLASADQRLLSHSFPLRPRARDGNPRTRGPFLAPPRLRARCLPRSRASGSGLSAPRGCGENRRPQDRSTRRCRRP